MALSPMMQHYMEVKEKHPDCLIFYRLGDFYELFFEDAKEASKLLDLTLTGRDCGLSERAPMCGVPHHAADLYISKLVSLGKRVAICEQLSEPNGKELVKRDIVRIVTAGTVIEDSLIDEKNNNFIASVCFINKEYALSWVDITTGEFYVQTFSGDNAYTDFLDAIVRVSPVEIISNSHLFELSKDIPLVKHKVLPAFTLYVDSNYSLSSAEKTLKTQFNVLNLVSFNLEENKVGISAAGALISYLKETQKHALSNIIKLQFVENDEFLKLDINAIKNLELIKTQKDGKRYGSLLWVIDKTCTNMGARTLNSWVLSPLKDIDKINNRLDGVETLFENVLLRQSLTGLLNNDRDLGRLTGKISNGNLMPRDVLAIGESLSILPSIKFKLSGIDVPIISKIREDLGDFFELSELLRSAINQNLPTNMKDGGYINDGFDEQLDELRAISKNGVDLIKDLAENERIKTGIRTLKIDYNRVFGYYIEVTNSFKNSVPYEYIRKQTLANAERYITEELKELEEKILTSTEKAIKLELNIFNKIKGLLLSKIDLLIKASDAIGVLDALNGLATVAKTNNYVRPKIVSSENDFNIVDGRHPIVEVLCKEKFVSNNTVFDNDTTAIVLTGPNMAGKSTYMRQVALITIMAHMGAFVPAKSAQIPIVDKVFTRIGASDNLILDQSTFMVEMSEMANIINNATNNSLIIVDELGRGTSTYDGLSIAWAVLEFLVDNIKAKTLFATHYHELVELETLKPNVKNYKVTVKEIGNDIVFMRKIVRGGASRSFGIEVASLAGIPQEVTRKSKTILKKLETSKGINNVINEETNEPTKSEVEKMLEKIDLNAISPIQAFQILVELKDKI